MNWSEDALQCIYVAKPMCDAAVQSQLPSLGALLCITWHVVTRGWPQQRRDALGRLCCHRILAEPQDQVPPAALGGGTCRA
jgi:hypothetical protein